MPRIAFSLALLAVFAATAPVAAQPKFNPKPQNPVIPQAGGKLPPRFAALADVSVDVVPASVKWGETVTVKLTVALKPGVKAWTYPFFPKDSEQASRNSVELPPPGDLIFIGKLTDPTTPPVKQKPRVGAKNGEMDQYYDQPVTWEFKAVVSPTVKPGKKIVAFDDISIQVCDDDNCHIARGKHLPTATLEVIEGASERVNLSDLAAALEVLKIQKSVIPSPGGPTRDVPQVLGPTPTGNAKETGVRKVAKLIDGYTAELKAIAESIVPAEAGSDTGGGKPGQSGLWAFIATAAAWGLISLITPCVFPMIPITVSIFLKQAQGSLRERLKLAAVYSGTIIVVLGVSAFALLKFMAWLSAHPVTNILLALIFIVLALSLFGMYEIMLPNSLAKRLQAKQAKGGTIGTIFGALAFTVISFTCVAPFLGGFAGISAGSGAEGSLIAMPTAREIAGGLAFATAFAAPFFILALVPGLMKALPKSGGWLDSVKVVMGFLELAAALKFLRTAELRIFPTPQYFTYDVVLGGWVAISVACGLYLLNVYRLPHDEEKPNIGVPRLLFALLFLGLALYLLPALFKGADDKRQRPAGAVYAWIEAFLLPESEPWPTDLKNTIERSKASGKPVFVDFTGVTCTNCKYNEETVFSRPELRSQFEQFERVQLYTDEVPAQAYVSDPGLRARKAEGRVNADFQVAVFKDGALPLYAVLMPQPDGKLQVIGVYPEGKINDPAKFAQFLKDSLEKAKPKK
ncbi:MAG: thioredoxin family protein [Planctomycetia bacterium]|nr:thioredoxin family protein [Planctomycetia bacterium]